MLARWCECCDLLETSRHCVLCDTERFCYVFYLAIFLCKFFSFRLLPGGNQIWLPALIYAGLNQLNSKRLGSLVLGSGSKGPLALGSGLKGHLTSGTWLAGCLALFCLLSDGLLSASILCLFSPAPFPADANHHNVDAPLNPTPPPPCRQMSEPCRPCPAGRRSRFTPYLRLSASGAMLSSVVRGVQAVSSDWGISYLSLRPCGGCTCRQHPGTDLPLEVRTGPRYWRGIIY